MVRWLRPGRRSASARGCRPSRPPGAAAPPRVLRHPYGVRPAAPRSLAEPAGSGGRPVLRSVPTRSTAGDTRRVRQCRRHDRDQQADNLSTASPKPDPGSGRRPAQRDAGALRALSELRAHTCGLIIGRGCRRGAARLLYDGGTDGDRCSRPPRPATWRRIAGFRPCH